MNEAQGKFLLPALPEFKLHETIADLAERKRECESLLKIMEDWKQIQLSYHKKIGDLSEGITKIITSKKTSKALGFQKDIYHNLWYVMNVVAVQSKNIALKIDDDMITEARETIKKMKSDLNASQLAEKSQRKILLAKRKGLQKSYTEFLDSKRVMEEAHISKFVLEQYVDSNLEMRMQVNRKFCKEVESFKLQEYNHQLALREYNLELDQWSAGYNDTLKEAGCVQVTYLKLVSQIYLKCQLHRVAEYKTVLHQLERIEIKTLDVQEIEASYASMQMVAPKAQGQVFTSFVVKSIQMIENKTLQECITYSKNTQIKEVLKGFKTVVVDKTPKQEQSQEVEESRQRSESTSNPAKYYSQLSKFFIQSLQGDLNEEGFLKLRTMLLNNHKRRIDFISFLQRYRIEGKCHMKLPIRRVQKVLQMFLDICLKVKDGFCCRPLMVLLFTYFFMFKFEKKKTIDAEPQCKLEADQTNKVNYQSFIEHNSQAFKLIKRMSEPVKHIVVNLQGQRIYIQSLVKDHALWKQLDYWESVLIESIYEEIVGHRRGSRGSLQEEQLPTQQEQAQVQKNIVFSQLLAISCNMVLFGRTIDQTKAFVTRFTKLFNLGNQRAHQIYNSLQPSSIHTAPQLLQEALRS